MRFSDSELRGRTVIASDGSAVGEANAIYINTGSWRVDTVQVRLRKDVADRIGADRGIFHPGMLDVPSQMVQSVGDAIVLSVTVDALRQLLPGVAEPAHSH